MLISGNKTDKYSRAICPCRLFLHNEKDTKDKICSPRQYTLGNHNLYQRILKMRLSKSNLLHWQSFARKIDKIGRKRQKISEFSHSKSMVRRRHRHSNARWPWWTDDGHGRGQRPLLNDLTIRDRYSWCCSPYPVELPQWLTHLCCQNDKNKMVRERDRDHTTWAVNRAWFLAIWKVHRLELWPRWILVQEDLDS